MSEIMKTIGIVGSKEYISTKKLLESGDKIKGLDHIDG